jgi:predicted MFS family arabinose efflux permease
MVESATLRRRPGWDLGLGRELGLAFWGMLFLEAAFGSYMGIWPLWIEHLGASVAIVGLLLGASGILRPFALLPSATLAERFGVRRLVVAARCAALLGLVSAALATHWTHLALMIIGTAVGELAFPLIQSHVTAHAGASRIRAFSLVFTVGPSIALAVTPLLAGALIQVAGMRSAFVLAAVCTAASIAFFCRLSPEPPANAGPRPVGSTYGAALADSAIRRLLVLQGITIFSLALGTSFVPTFLEDQRGLAPATIAAMGAMAAVGSILFGLAVTRSHALQQSPFVGAAIAVGTTAIGFGIFLSSASLPLIGLAFICRGGLFSAWALFAAAIGETATAANRARSFAMGDIVAGCCFSLAPMVAGGIYAVNPYGPLTLATALALALTPTLVMVQRHARRQGGQPVPDPEQSSPQPRAAPVDAPIA